MSKKNYKQVDIDLIEEDFPQLSKSSTALAKGAGIKFLQEILDEGHQVSFKHWKDSVQVSVYISNQGDKGVTYIVEGSGETVADALAGVQHKLIVILDWSVEDVGEQEKKSRPRFS